MAANPMMNLTGYIMGEALREGVKWAPSLMGLVRFGGLKMEYFPFLLLCIDGYIKGASIGYTYRDKYELLVGLLVSPNKVTRHAEQLHDLARKRVENYDGEITSIIDFIFDTELASDKNTFDDLIKKAKKKVKIEQAGPRLRQLFEEGIAFGVTYPAKVKELFRVERRTSSYDWEQARLEGLNPNLQNQEIDLDFLMKWARHNVGMYCRQYRPDVMAALEG